MNYIIANENEMSTFEVSTFDYQDLCRLCLAKDRVVVPIFEDERQMLHKITTCRLPIQVSKEDKLPKKICSECLDKVEMFYQFWNTTLNVEEQLRQLTGEDKILYEMQVFNSMNNRYDVAELLNDISNTISTESDVQFTKASLDTNSTFSGQSTEIHDHNQIVTHVLKEVEENHIKESVPPGHQYQSDYANSKNGMLQLTTLETVPLSNLNSNLEPVSSTYVENVLNPTYDQMPDPALFLEQFSDPSSVSISCLDKFPDSELIADSELLSFSIFESEVIPQSMSVPEPISKSSFELKLVPHIISTPVSNPPSLSLEPILSTSNGDKWDIPNKNRPRRFRNQYFCNECLVGFTDKVKLGKHMIEMHQIQNPFGCDICGKSFRSAVTISRHKLLHDEKPKQFKCDYCGYATHQKSNLSSHIKRLHLRKYEYICQGCNKGFLQRTKFAEHKGLCKKAQSKEQSIGHPCEYCCKIIRYKRNLRNHMVEHHPEMISEPVEPKSRINCPQCNKTFVKELSLQRHVKAHHLEPNKKFTCEICGVTLSCKSVLTQHLRGHRGEKAATCDVCGKKFSKWQNVRVHQRVHTGERPYKCTHCSKAFTQRTTLVHHTRIHTGERPHKCDQCGKGFVSGSLLKKHNAGKCQKSLQEKGSIMQKAGSNSLSAKDSKNEC